MVKSKGYRKGLKVAYKIWSKKLERYLVEYASGEIYSRPKIDKRTRILCIIITLVTLGKENQLKWHILGGLKNGILKKEIVETLIHASIYAGFPVS